MRSVFLDYQTLSHGDLDPRPLLEILPDIELHGRTMPAQIPGRIAGARIVCTNKAPITRAMIEQAPDLRLIAVAATGCNNIDLDAARRCGVTVSNVRDYCSDSVAQHVWGLILALTQRLREYSHRAIDGTWAKAGQFTLLDFPVRELRGRTLGIVGWGQLGRAVARIGEAFGMRILIANRPGGRPLAGRLDLPDLLAQADILSLHCPLTDSTRGLIGARELAGMKPDALLINTARGALVDSAALAAALRGGRLGGAGIDVLVQEPPVNGDALLDESIPNLLVTPHMAWASREARQRCLEQVADNVRQFLKGTTARRVV